MENFEIAVVIGVFYVANTIIKKVLSWWRTNSLERHRRSHEIVMHNLRTGRYDSGKKLG